MGLYWYTAPVCDVDSDTVGYHPGTTSGCPGLIPGMARIHCYDPEPDPEADPPIVPLTCLVGALDEQTRDGWTAKTLGEAQAIFEAFYGYPPTDDEVY